MIQRQGALDIFSVIAFKALNAKHVSHAVSTSTIHALLADL